MTYKEYIKKIDQIFQTGSATEYSYRSALEDFLCALLPKLTVINEPKGQKCGKPDYIIARKDKQPIFFIETKDVGDNDLDGRSVNKEQFDRYKASLSHIIFSDYLDFHFYENGQLVERIVLGEFGNGHYRLKEENAEKFISTIHRFAEAKVQPVTSAVKLAEIMAGKARLLKYAISQALNEEKDTYDNQQLWDLYEAFREILIHDIEHEKFADMYAQTIAYGLFGARLHDKTPENFTRQEAVGLIPKSNPFLRYLFNSVAGIDLDERVAWIVDDLVATFGATDLQKVMKQYRTNKQHNDPLIHFYEDFLKFYDPEQRKNMGVFYTPQPVVGYIVRAVDEVLRNEFGITRGLADSAKQSFEVTVEQGYDRRHKDNLKRVTKQIHRVQILDPATGTGTFLAEVVNTIHDEITKKNAGIWQEYVEKDLIPRLNGFEIIMASYAIAHLKLDMVLQDTGYEHMSDARFNVFLTNSLEEGTLDSRSFFLKALSEEARRASTVKLERPVMVMVGNPPYSGESQNKGTWIMDKMLDYKKEPGGNATLQERNPKWLNDDYVKFIRLAQDYIERNEKGVIGFINPHGFLDNPTFRGMRWNLLRTFDKIYTINLHGNGNRHEMCPDGSKDENVFDILQGVSINIFVKTNQKINNSLGKVFYADLWGRRNEKYEFLDQHNLSDTDFQEVEIKTPMYYFIPKDYSLYEEYEAGFAINDLFIVNSVGMVTSKDSYLVCSTTSDVHNRIADLLNMEKNTFLSKYGLRESSDWKYIKAKNDVGDSLSPSKIIPYFYRPFDIKYIYYTGRAGGLAVRPRYDVQRHLLHSDNYSLLTCRQCISDNWSLVSVSKYIIDSCTVSNKTKECSYTFPLYVYQSDLGKDKRVPNFSSDVLNKIEKGLGESVEPLELFDYIYAVLYSPSYRQRYQEYLKSDFPRIPYPQIENYHELVKLGGQLRKLHLMEGIEEWDSAVGFPSAEGHGVINALRYEEESERVYINEKQYFSHVPILAWNLYIGGYQPAQKWLKDRQGASLTPQDVEHYEQMIFALSETVRLMELVDSKMNLPE